ncbi:hypothetical protein [Bacillus pseudomycoides]
MANSLKELGVKTGDRVVVYKPNISKTIIVFLFLKMTAGPLKLFVMCDST